MLLSTTRFRVDEDRGCAKFATLSLTQPTPRPLQVPFTFDMGRDSTIEEVGASRVQIHTGRDSDCKRMGEAKPGARLCHACASDVRS